MENLTEIKQWLRGGDYQVIRELVPGTSKSTIMSVMSGRRNHAKNKGAKIFEAAKKIAESRKQLLEQASVQPR
ncbi:hypothetical protein GU926_08350 [Nibribacter ruber]|uniref:Transcriptional regulator n=1 Tax=Nibribacter ruber TaxID=2698458 RepID=A0A6P1NUP6_9BACT|nr:hypothetical protein [Nibribacter ruber]QHL87447.1 hypothetical protein GU926_08350 [Nibribacter ruber]